jgi:hypothetical protein
MKTTTRTSPNDNPSPTTEQAAIKSLCVGNPTAAMKRSGIKDWAKLDTELAALVNAWPVDSVPNRTWFYRWARIIHKSVKADFAAPVCENAGSEVLKNVVPRFPAFNAFADWQVFRAYDAMVLQLIADLDEPTRLVLAAIYWRWGQVIEAIHWRRRQERWANEAKERAERQKSQVVFDLRPEYMPALERFRHRFLAGENLSDAQVAWHFFRAAFLIPDQIHEASRRFIKYRDAEGLSDTDAMRAMVIAQQPAQDRRAA